VFTCDFASLPDSSKSLPSSEEGKTAGTRRKDGPSIEKPKEAIRENEMSSNRWFNPGFHRGGGGRGSLEPVLGDDGANTEPKDRQKRKC